MPSFDLRHPATLSRVTVHKSSSKNKIIVASVFLVFYAMVLPWVYSTVGQPYETALAELNTMKANVTESAHLEILENQGVYETSFDDEDEDDELGEERKFGSRRIKRKKMKENLKKKKKEPTAKLEDIDLARLPNSYLPSALSSFFLFLLLTCTALFFLVQKWLVWFKVYVMYEDATSVTSDSVIQITPLPHRGRPAITT